MPKFVTLAVILVFCGLAAAQTPLVPTSGALKLGTQLPAVQTPTSPMPGTQMPMAQLPRKYLDTTFALPTGGTTWAAHTSAQLASALKVASPGDVIVLDAGVTYVGNFQLNGKSNPNNKWIYIVSSDLTSLPEHTRVSPGSALHMPKLVTTNGMPLFQLYDGANHWRLAGLEVTDTAPSTWFLIGSSWPYPNPLPDSITIDRCYFHGAPAISTNAGIQGTGTNYAVIDSYVSDIHAPGTDTQAFGVNNTTGPVKIVNNYLEAAGENIMFGGSGGNSNSGVPSDIEIRNNYIFKPLSWVPFTQGNHPTMVVKNAFECKSCQRVLFDSNVIENVWAGGQMGFAVVLTVRTSQSGDFAVVNDITITNNVFKNVVSFVSGLAKDDVCGTVYPNCLNAGSQDRWYIANNLITLYDPNLPGGTRNVTLSIQPGVDHPNGGVQGVMRDVVFQHNTVVPAASTPCWASVYFSTGTQKLPLVNLTQNIWLMDNVFCREPSGDWGLQGTAGLTQYMGVPGPVDTRFRGNVMYVPVGDKVQTFPAHNYATTLPIIYVAPQNGNYRLASPYWTDTSDGKLAGIN